MKMNGMNIKSKIMRLLGVYSFEIYVLQGLCMTLLHSNLIYIENELAYSVTTILMLIALSTLLHPVFGYVNNIMRRGCK